MDNESSSTSSNTLGSASNSSTQPLVSQELQDSQASQDPRIPQSSLSSQAPQNRPKTRPKTLTIALVAILVVAAIACCVALAVSNISSNNKSQNNSNTDTNTSDSDITDPDTDDTASQDVKPVGATIEDGKWEVTFPGYTSGDLTVYNETYGFTLPAGVTDVASTMIDQTKSNDTFEYKINSLTTTTGNYDAQTVCGYTDNTSKIALAGLIRQPAPAAEPVVNGNTITSVTMLSTDDVYTLYLWLGLEDDSGKCNLDSAKSDKAHELINELLGLSFAE